MQCAKRSGKTIQNCRVKHSWHPWTHTHKLNQRYLYECNFGTHLISNHLHNVIFRGQFWGVGDVFVQPLQEDLSTRSPPPTQPHLQEILSTNPAWCWQCHVFPCICTPCHLGCTYICASLWNTRNSGETFAAHFVFHSVLFPYPFSKCLLRNCPRSVLPGQGRVRLHRYQTAIDL